MKFDKETIIGIVICMVLPLAWPMISQSMGWTPAPESAAEETSAPAPESDAEETPAPAPQANAAEDIIVADEPDAAEKCDDFDFSNEFITLTVSGENGAIKSIRFLKHLNNDRESQITIDNAGLFALDIPDTRVVRVTAITRTGENEVTVETLLSKGGALLRLTRIYTIDTDYSVKCQYSLQNLSMVPVTLTGVTVQGVSLAPWHIISGDNLRSVAYRLDYMTDDGDHEDIDGDEDDEDFYPEEAIRVRWCSVSNRYFCSILKPEENGTFQLYLVNPREEIEDARGKKHYILTAGATMPEFRLLQKESKSFEFSCYTGPKSSDALAAFVKGGEDVVHLAWGPLNLLARFLMWVLNLLYAICHSYGLSIILLTLLVRTAFYPLTSKGNESMRKMQKVQPKFKELKEKYKDNPQLLNQKMTELYRQEGINPLAGCLPILLQIPIFFALYAMLDNAIALRHESFLWAKNLAAADTVFSIPLGFTLPLFDINAIPINPLVLAMTALMIVQQRMTPMSGDPVQKKMMMMMPVIMLLFLYSLPSGLTLYWTVSNIFSIVQLYIQKKRRESQTADETQSK
ncbi:MAG: membrane protein insertase YidC [Lentisphaerae bacterium]|nr:membrane protein insertase YidC [Lentisphaerota bacterium]